MKLVKLLSLAATAAFAAMAFVGASSAFAEPTGVLLCEKLELVCTHPYPNLTTIVGHATNPKILSSLGTIECEKSLIEVTLLQGPKLEKLILGHILSLKLEGNCHLGGTSCTITVGHVGAMSITHGPNPLEWRYVLVPLEGISTEKTVKCGLFINCTYIGGEETELTSTNSESGEVTLTANEAPLKKSKGFCPEVSKLDVTYLVLGPGRWLES